MLQVNTFSKSATKAIRMKSTEVLNPRRSDIDRTGRLHKLTVYYIHCADALLLHLCLELLWQKPNLSLKGDTEKKL